MQAECLQVYQPRAIALGNQIGQPSVHAEGVQEALYRNSDPCMLGCNNGNDVGHELRGGLEYSRGRGMGRAMNARADLNPEACILNPES